MGKVIRMGVGDAGGALSGVLWPTARRGKEASAPTCNKNELASAARVSALLWSRRFPLPRGCPFSVLLGRKNGCRSTLYPNWSIIGPGSDCGLQTLQPKKQRSVRREAQFTRQADWVGVAVS